MMAMLTVPNKLDPYLRLLMLLARLQLSEPQSRRALALCEHITDWEGFTHRARQRFILPLVYRHLRQLSPPSLSGTQLNIMKLQSLHVLQRNLNVSAEQRALVSKLLQPLKLPHVFFKGPSLALRYYDEPAMRLSRDIDVLVPRNRMIELIERALELGYIPGDPSPLKTDRQSLAFLARAQGVITLISPRGVAIEFHQKINNLANIFDADKLISGAEHVTSGPIDFPVMPTNELFVYICFHHTRHFWSHLHWFVDLDAIQRHPDFDLQKVRMIASRRGLTTTVEICLELFQAIASPCPWDFEPISPQGRELLMASVDALAGGQAKEDELHKRMATPDFAFAWQTTPGHLCRWKLFGWSRIFRPSYADYRDWPLSDRWQWIYRPIRPFREAARRFVVSETP